LKGCSTKHKKLREEEVTMMYKFNQLVRMFVPIVLFVMLAGCAKKEAKIINIDGSSTVYPITQAVAEEFSKEYRDIKVSVGISGTGGGFKKFVRGELDIVDASRPIKPEEMDSAKNNGIEYIELPVAFDGITVVVHRDNTWVDYLTVKELRKIWEPEAEGKITRWNQIRKEWPNEEIHLFGPGTASGTFDYFTEVIVGKAKSSRGDYTSSEDDNVLVHGVATDKFALGYFGLAYYEENRDRLKAIPIDDEDDTNGKGPILPTRKNIEKGIYQPLSRPLFIYINKKSLERKEVQDFVEFYLKNAYRIIEEVKYVPLPKQVYQLVENRFRNRITGSVFFNAKPGIKIEELLKVK
jgi:phosphate transport system substrate-binding protein